jgi:hypothetical protein
MRSAVRLALLLALPALMPACSTSGGGASDDSVRVQGHVSLDVYEGPICGDAGVSMLGRCSRETYTGSIEGDGDVAVTSMNPLEPDGVVAIAENEVIHLSDGDVTATVNAVYHAESSDHPFVSMHTITGGNGKYAQASGYIHVWGSAGAELADYLAVIRLAK